MRFDTIKFKAMYQDFSSFFQDTLQVYMGTKGIQVHPPEADEQEFHTWLDYLQCTLRFPLSGVNHKITFVTPL